MQNGEKSLPSYAEVTGRMERMEGQLKGGHKVATVVKASACGLSLASATSAWLLHAGLAFNDHFQPRLPSWWSFQPSLHKYLTSSGEVLGPGQRKWVPTVVPAPWGTQTTKGLPGEARPGRALGKPVGFRRCVFQEPWKASLKPS